jgi:hypothetical protein
VNSSIIVRFQSTSVMLRRYAYDLDADCMEGIERFAQMIVDKADEIDEFIWRIVDNIHDDAEIGRLVLGCTDNTDILPNLSYEITKCMMKAGFYSVWGRVSDNKN